MEGKLIVIEGSCDGVGKSTQSALLRQGLEKEGFKVCSHHFPTYNSIQGALVEQYLRGNYGGQKDLSPYLVNAFYAVDRAVTWNTELKKEYEDGSILLMDRYTTSSIIYQSSIFESIEEKKRFIDFVVDYEYNKLGIKAPDDVIFLYADFSTVYEVLKRRVGNEGIEHDIYERDLELLERVYKNACWIAEYLSWNFVKCDENGKFKKIEEIHEEVYTKVKRTIKKAD